MGTLMATGFMRGGKALEAASEIGTEPDGGILPDPRSGTAWWSAARRSPATRRCSTCWFRSAAAGCGSGRSHAVAARAGTGGQGRRRGIGGDQGDGRATRQGGVLRAKRLGLQDAGAAVGFFLIEISGFVGHDRGNHEDRDYRNRSDGHGVGLTLLAKGHQVYCTNRTPANADPLVKAGAYYCAETPREAAEQASHVIILVWNEAGLRTALEGADGLCRRRAGSRVHRHEHSAAGDRARGRRRLCRTRCTVR